MSEPSAHYLAGLHAIAVLRGMTPPPDRAGPFHDAAETALQRAGFFVRREAYVAVRESGRGQGRIDLLARYGDGFVAIELDNKTPRARSLDKLRAFTAFRLVVLRGAEHWPNERGIDAIISLPVVPA